MAHANHTLGPLVYGNRSALSVLAGLLVAARTRAVDVALLGDSRVTSPSGKGLSTVHALNALSAATFGQLGALPWCAAYSSGGGSPPGTFPYKMATNGQGSTVAPTAANGRGLPPNFLWYTPNANTNGGFYSLIQPDDANAEKHIRGLAGASHFNIKQATMVDVIVTNRAGATANDLLVQLLDLTTTAFTWGATVLGSTVDTALGLDSVVSVVSDEISAAAADNSLNHAGAGFGSFTAGMQVRVSGFTTNGAVFHSRVVSATASKIVLNDDITLVNEGAGGMVTVRSFTVSKRTYGPYANGTANPYAAINTRNNSAPAGTNFELVAQRARYASGGGLIFTPLGLGSAKYADFLNDTGNGGASGDISGVGTMKYAGASIPAFGFEIVVLLGGQNDASADLSVGQVKAAILRLIAKWRDWSGTLTPFVICNSPHNGGLTSGRQTTDSTYYQAYTEVADEVPNVVVLNTRLALERHYGWNVTSGPTTDSGRPGSFATALTYRGPWAAGTAYSVADVVNMNGLKGWAISCSGGSGTFSPGGETITQGAATGLYAGESGGVVYVLQTGATDFSAGGGGITGATSGATRATVTAVNHDQLYGRAMTISGATNDVSPDYTPRQYWRCLTGHTATYPLRPGSQSQDQSGHTYWEPVYPWYDPLDPAHWHADGAWAFGSCVFGLLHGAAEDALRLAGYTPATGGPAGIRTPRITG